MANGSTQDGDLLMLVEKYVNSSCSKEELEQLVVLAKDGSDELFKALKFQWSKANDESKKERTHWDALFHSMMNQAREAETVIPFQATKMNSNVYRIGGARRMWTGIAATAAVVLVLFTTAFLLIKKENKDIAISSPTNPVINEILPGRDKAVLTLANGRQIVLDTASNGALAREGGIKVIKVGGQLTYSAETRSTEVLYNTIATPKGGQYQLELADGSKVWLNAASSLRFPTAFAGKERTVELTGEGYFEVAHKPAVPFYVKVNGIDVEVLGTHFNINSYEDEPSVKTTLLEGRVRVAKNGKHVLLNPGQQAVLQPGHDNIKVAYDVDVEEVVAWKNGRFLFSGTDVEAIMRQVARWYDVDVVYARKLTGTISGSLPRSQNVSQLLRILEATGKIEFQINGRKIIVKPK